MLRGNAFLIMWHDIAPGEEDDYQHWHTKQHMVERLWHPGFQRSRRGVNQHVDRQRFFTLYEGDALETFVSSEYLASLNEPTEWTNSVAPHFRNFLRCACQVAHSSGRGVGGALASFRGGLPEGCDEQDFYKVLREWLEDLQNDPRVSGVHLAFARKEISNAPTTETRIRPPMHEDDFDFVLIVESYGLCEADALTLEVAEVLKGLRVTGLVSQQYDIAYTLQEGDLTPESVADALNRTG